MSMPMMVNIEKNKTLENINSIRCEPRASSQIIIIPNQQDLHNVFQVQVMSDHNHIRFYLFMHNLSSTIVYVIIFIAFV